MTDEVHAITMPKLGESVTEGTVSQWLKEVGQEVAFDDPLFEVSTDKVDSEVPSPHDGILLEILVQSGETVPVGTELARIGPQGAVVASPGQPLARAIAQDNEPTHGQAPAAPGGKPHEIRMPKLGESVTEGTVNAWSKAVGDTVTFDDVLFDVSTDKVDSEIPSPYDGVLIEIVVTAGETVAVGTVLARIAPVGAEPPVLGPIVQTPAPTPTVVPSSAAPALATRGAAPLGRGSGGGLLLSPVVRRLAAKHRIDLSQVAGSGKGGRIMREDVRAAPATGHGRAAPRQTAAAPASDAPTHTPAVPEPSLSGRKADEVVPLSRIRLITAERMLRSKEISPHVWTSVEVDLEAIERVRQSHKDRFRKENGAPLTYLPFIARATCDALHAFPTVNSSVDLASKTMTLHKQVHLAIAVDLNEQGLMAPVIKDADTLNLRGMAQAIRAIGEAAKNRTLKSDDLSGSTFTLTNPGPLGSYASAPIINQPNVAIMSTEGVARRAVVVGDAIAIHHVCVLGFSYDHRAFDGVTAARFLMYVRDALQDRDWTAECG